MVDADSGPTAAEADARAGASGRTEATIDLSMMFSGGRRARDDPAGIDD
jgi:hypothetical protein